MMTTYFTRKKISSTFFSHNLPNVWIFSSRKAIFKQKVRGLQCDLMEILNHCRRTRRAKTTLFLFFSKKKTLSIILLRKKKKKKKNSQWYLLKFCLFSLFTNFACLSTYFGSSPLSPTWTQESFLLWFLFLIPWKCIYGSNSNRPYLATFRSNYVLLTILNWDESLDII